MGNSDDYMAPAQRLEEAVRALELQMHNISATVGTLSGMSTVGNVLEQGFKMLEYQLAPIGALPAQLAPLRDLAPRRVPIPEAAAQTVATVLGAMRRPELPGFGSLGIQQANVSFIGQGAVAAVPPVAALPLAGVVPVQGGGNAGQVQVVAPNQQALGGGI